MVVMVVMVVVVLVRINIHAAVVDVAHILVAIVGAVVVVDVGLLRWVRVVGLVGHSDTVVAEDACENEGIGRRGIRRKLRKILVTVVRLFGGNEFVIEDMVFVSKGVRDLGMRDEMVRSQGHHAWMERLDGAGV